MGFRLTYAPAPGAMDTDPGVHAFVVAGTFNGHCDRVAAWMVAARNEHRDRTGRTTAHLTGPEPARDMAIWLLTDPFESTVYGTDRDDVSDDDLAEEQTLLRFKVALTDRMWHRPGLVVDIDVCTSIFGTGDPDPHDLIDDDIVEAHHLSMSMLDVILGHIDGLGPNGIARYANHRVDTNDVAAWSAEFHSALAARRRALTPMLAR